MAKFAKPGEVLEFWVLRYGSCVNLTSIWFNFFWGCEIEFAKMG